MSKFDMFERGLTAILLPGLCLLCAPLARAQVLIEPGDNIQSLVNESPPGSEFILAAGTHHAEGLRLRSGNTLRGAPGAVMIGSLRLDAVSDIEIRDLRLQSRADDCIHVEDSTSIRVRSSEIGPCEGNGIVALRSEGVLITDNYIHPDHPVTECCDNGDGVFAREVRNIRIAGNVIAFGESNIEFQRVTGGEAVGNYLLNPLGPFPRGQQVQAYDGCSEITIEGNLMEAIDDPGLPFGQRQEDAVNAGQSSNIRVNRNFIAGGTSPSGCGIIADEDADAMSIVDNVLWRTGQCGIGVASGRDHRIVGNKILNSFVEHPNAGNTAIYVWRQYAGECGPVRVSGNIAFAHKPWGEPSSFWKGGTQCDPVTVAQNVFGEAARVRLTAEAIESLRPAIPPQPQRCVAASPYSNQPSPAPCLGISSHLHSVEIPIRARTSTGQTP